MTKPITDDQLKSIRDRSNAWKRLVTLKRGEACDYAIASANDVPALIAEVERLKAVELEIENQTMSLEEDKQSRPKHLVTCYDCGKTFNLKDDWKEDFKSYPYNNMDQDYCWSCNKQCTIEEDLERIEEENGNL